MKSLKSLKIKVSKPDQDLNTHEKRLHFVADMEVVVKQGKKI